MRRVLPPGEYDRRALSPYAKVLRFLLTESDKRQSQKRFDFRVARVE